MDEKIRINKYLSDIGVCSRREADRLTEAVRVQESLEMDMPEDFYSIDLMSAYEALGAITGESVGEDLVNEIFSKFCMGK